MQSLKHIRFIWIMDAQFIKDPEFASVTSV